MALAHTQFVQKERKCFVGLNEPLAPSIQQYADLCNFYEGGAMTLVSAAMLESCLTNMQLTQSWTKTVSTYVTSALHLIRDHTEATQGICTDDCYIEKLNAAFFEHKDMAAHI